MDGTDPKATGMRLDRLRRVIALTTWCAGVAVSVEVAGAGLSDAVAQSSPALAQTSRGQVGSGQAGSGQASSAVALKGAEAGAALERGDVDQAVLLYNAALEDTAIANDRRAVLLVERGAALMRRHTLKAALDDFNKAASLYPEYPAVYINRGNLLLAMNQGPETIAEAIRDFDRAMALAPGLAAAYGNRGAAKLKLGQAFPAIADFTRAVTLQPQNPAALNGRGMARLMLGQTAAAIRDFSRAVVINPGFAQAYRNRAAAMMRLGRPADAAEDLSRALAFDARRVEDYVARGNAYLATGNAAAAQTDFAKVVELAPRSVAGHIGLGTAEGLSNAIEEALADLSRAIEIEPRSARAYAVRAWVYIKSQQLELGQKDVDRALRLEPVTADAYWAQGELQEATGDRDAATGSYARALGLDIHHRETLAALVRLGLEPQRQDSPLPAAGIEGWRVSVSNGLQYTATNAQFAGLTITLEMMGEGQPQIIAWERQKPPYAGYGLLHYRAGVLPGAQGADSVECTAVVDLTSATVIALPVEKLGTRTASYTWGEARLAITGADGLAESVPLGDRRDRRETVEAAAPRRVETPGVQASSGYSSRSSGESTREAPVRRAAAPRRSKSLFDLLFGN